MNDPYLFQPAAPYDFRLSLRSGAGFASGPPVETEILRIAARIQGQPVALEVRPAPGQEGQLQVSGASSPQAGVIAAWVLFADMDLTPFYRQVESHPLFGPLTARLYGLKPMRPASLLEMAVTAIIEQQISLAAAYKIRARLVERFGDRVEDLWVFPTAGRLARASH